MKKRYIILILSSILFIVILCIICIPMIQDAEKLKSKTYKINELMNCKSNNYEVTVTDVQIKNSNDYSGINDGTELVAVYLKIKNNGDSNLVFNEKNLKLINSNGEIIDNLIGSIREMWNGQRLNNFELAPNGEKTGYIIFLNNSLDNSNLTATYNCNDSWQYNISLTK